VKISADPLAPYLGQGGKTVLGERSADEAQREGLLIGIQLAIAAFDG